MKNIFFKTSLYISFVLLCISCDKKVKHITNDENVAIDTINVFSNQDNTKKIQFPFCEELIDEDPNYSSTYNVNSDTLYYNDVYRVFVRDTICSNHKITSVVKPSKRKSDLIGPFAFDGGKLQDVENRNEKTKVYYLFGSNAEFLISYTNDSIQSTYWKTIDRNDIVEAVGLDILPDYGYFMINGADFNHISNDTLYFDINFVLVDSDLSCELTYKWYEGQDTLYVKRMLEWGQSDE